MRLLGVSDRSTWVTMLDVQPACGDLAQERLVRDCMSIVFVARKSGATTNPIQSFLTFALCPSFKPCYNAFHVRMPMDHEEAGRYWNANAEAWTQLARAGYDVYRDYLNTPAFLAMLPDVRGLSGIDIGCGEGHNTRLLARLGARLAAIDIADTFIRHAREMEEQAPLGIDYHTSSALELPFPDAHFDFATAFMSLMDMPEIGRVLAEAYRVLKPGGFLQFSITHPCFDTPHHRNLRDESGITYAFEIGGYFRNLEGEVSEWTFNTAPAEIRQSLPKFKTPRFTRTLSQWLNLLLDVGFRLERVEEPCPSDEVVARCPAVQDAQVVSYFLHVRVRKPGSLASSA